MAVRLDLLTLCRSAEQAQHLAICGFGRERTRHGFPREITPRARTDRISPG